MQITITGNNYAPIVETNEGQISLTVTADSVRTAPLTLSQEKVKAALLHLLEARGEDGEYLFAAQSHWYAPYRVLSETLGYPREKKLFVRQMADLGMDTARIPCVYESLKKASPAGLAHHVELWRTDEARNAAAQRQICVAKQFLALLAETEEETQEGN